MASRAVPWAWESVTSRRWRGARARGTAGRVPGTQDPRDGVSRDWRTHIIRRHAGADRPETRPGHEMYTARDITHPGAAQPRITSSSTRADGHPDDGRPKTRRGSQTSEATRKWYNLLLEVQSFGNVDASSPTQSFLRSTSTTVQLYICWSSMWPVAKPHARTQPERALSRQVADV